MTTITPTRRGILWQCWVCSAPFQSMDQRNDHIKFSHPIEWQASANLPTPDKPTVTSAFSTFEDNVHAVFVELEALLLSKHHDYGPKNIANAPGGPHNGLRVRLYDKLARLSHWVDSNVQLKHETAEESYKDIGNYGVIGILVSRGLWPNE